MACWEVLGDSVANVCFNNILRLKQQFSHLAISSMTAGSQIIDTEPMHLRVSPSDIASLFEIFTLRSFAVDSVQSTLILCSTMYRFGEGD